MKQNVKACVLQCKNSIIRKDAWCSAAMYHANVIDSMIYPSSSSIDDRKKQIHSVNEHPIYNFIHRYYSYSLKQIKLYSPGINIKLESSTKDDLNVLLSPDNFDIIKNQYCSKTISIKKKKKLLRNQEILLQTTLNTPHFSCFGLHEWAMLAIGDGQESRHQSLPLRVSQETIDKIVKMKGSIRCTHYDAFRFFHPDVQDYNEISLSRNNQKDYEQGACVHATMDLFKYAYEIYPFISAELLRKCLSVSLKARHIDMRASPYDCSQIDGVDDPIKIETAEGRKQYATEQEKLYQLSVPLRIQLLEVYETVLLTEE